MRKLAAVILFASALGRGADWLNVGGDRQRSGWQKRERAINSQTVQGLQSIWKVKLGGGLTAPVILGHLVTYRGTVELVYVASASGEVFAVDGDFGKLFWKRKVASAAPIVAAPVIAASAIDEEEDDDAAQPVRPIYVLGGDGLQHALDPGDGRDLPDAKAPSVSVAQTVFTRKGRELAITVDPGSKLTVPGAVPLAGAFTGGVATWEDSDGVRWIYATTRTRVEAIRVDGTSERPVLVRVWTSQMVLNPGTPAIAGGLAFILSKGDRRRHAALLAFDAKTGKRLYTNGSAVTSFAHTGFLAVANGHVLFTTVDGTLWCFGFPVDI